MTNEEMNPEEFKEQNPSENDGNKDYSAYMPEDEQAVQKEEQVARTEQFGFERENQNLLWIAQKANEIRSTLGGYVIGQQQLVDLLLTGIFANGHLLLEGAPGLAKTLAAKVLAKSLDIDFSRIQFTPDMMPSDVLGTSVFNMQDSSFNFRKGPIFSNIVLIDEINRAPAKTQAALFEVMEERQITYDGVRYPMAFPFLVLATQNPIEQEGTYSLPEAQLDRFLFKVKLAYPDLSEEEEILKRYKNSISSPDISAIRPVLSTEDIQRIQDTVEQVLIENNLLGYIAALTHKTRTHAQIYLGASPRASLSMLRASKALAAIRGRDFVTPEDIQYVAVHVLNHRLILTPEAEMEGVSSEDVIREILKTIEVPR